MTKRKWDQKYKVEVLREDGRWIKQLGIENFRIKRIKEMVKEMDGGWDNAFQRKKPIARITKIKRRLKNGRK